MYSFLICFYILDYCYFENYEDDLGAILGAMSPDLLLDGMPIDRAFLNDWNAIVPSLPKNNIEIINKVDKYLEFYEANLRFSFPETRKMLKSQQVLSNIETAKEKAKKMCIKHNY